MIELQDVTKVYEGNVTGVEHINLTIEDGEFIFIVGESGSGKSTLLKLLMRELVPDEGAILIDGKDITKLRRSKVAELRRSMGIVFQDYRLLTSRTVYENVAFALEVIEVPPKKIKRSVPAALNLVGLAHKAKSMPNSISGGEQQRTAIARAIVNNPQVVLADEPTGALDTANGIKVVTLFKNLIEKEGLSIVMTTHDPGLMQMGDVVYEMSDGRITNASINNQEE